MFRTSIRLTGNYHERMRICGNAAVRRTLVPVWVENEPENELKNEGCTLHQS
jgi:hypothetical protein